ncbi:MAG TPA: OmpA family protein [Deltaproteobacteria bacterium]|nr:OmpA family protein [Deltaproteobacteria bacterium]
MSWIVTGVLLASGALAQDTIPQELPIEVERFRPMIDPYGYAVTESATTLGNLQIGVGFWGNYSENSAVLYAAGERIYGPPPRSPDSLIDQRSMVDLQLGMGLGDIFALAIDAPFVVWQQGFEPTADISPDPTSDLLPSSPGDLRISPKFVLVDINRGYPVGLALLATGTVPLGSTRSFIGEGDPTIAPMLAFEVADGAVRDRSYLARGALNVGARIKSPDTFLDTTFGTEFLYRGALSAKPADVLELGVDIVGSAAGNRVAQAPVELLPWLKLMGYEVATFTAGAGFGLNPGLGSPDLRVFGGLSIAPSFDPLALDRDNDGIPNRYDQCINIPEDLDQFEDRDGCPDEDNDADHVLDIDDGCPNSAEDFDDFQDADGCPDNDNDNDGVVDAQDACPMVPEDNDGFQDLDGCPDEDNDGDRILDAQDACPNAAETVNGFDDADGCPDEKPFIDTDGDGLSDEVDQCPTEAEDFDTWQDDDGCPDLDNDLDGVPDTSDQCPFDPETVNSYLDEDGCPDTAPSRVIVQQEKIVITEKVFFQYGKAVIQKVSFGLLDEVAQVINDNPRLTLIQIEGHTDSDGSEAFNLKLSQSRAAAVMRYLIAAGVDARRLEAKGFGESLPIDTNNTREGKARNRRVEFTILEQE